MFFTCNLLSLSLHLIKRKIYHISMGNFLLRPKGKKEGPIQAAIVNILKFGWDDLSLKLVYYFFRFFCMAQNVGQGMIKKKHVFQICMIQHVGQWHGPLHPLWGFYQLAGGQVWNFAKWQQRQKFINLWEGTRCAKQTNRSQNVHDHQPKLKYTRFSNFKWAGLRGTWSRSTRCTATTGSCSFPSTSSQVLWQKFLTGGTTTFSQVWQNIPLSCDKTMTWQYRRTE